MIETKILDKNRLKGLIEMIRSCWIFFFERFELFNATHAIIVLAHDRPSHSPSYCMSSCLHQRHCALWCIWYHWSPNTPYPHRRCSAVQSGRLWFPCPYWILVLLSHHCVLLLVRHCQELHIRYIFGFWCVLSACSRHDIELFFGPCLDTGLFQYVCGLRGQL